MTDPRWRMLSVPRALHVSDLQGGEVRPMQPWRMSLLAGAFAVIAGMAAAVEGAAQPAAPAPESRADEPVPGTLSLQQAIELALRRHPALALSKARGEVAKTGIAVAGSQYRPYFAADAAVGKTLAGPAQVARDDSGNQVEVDPFYEAKLSFVVPIVREGRLTFMTFPSEEAAKLRYDAVRYGEDRTRSEVIGSVRVAFLSVLLAKVDVELGKRTVELNGLLVDSARLRFNQQLIPLAEVLAAEAALGTAEADLAGARVTYTSRLQVFMTAIGLDPAAGPPPEPVDAGEPPGLVRALEDLVKEAYEHHPSVLAQQAKVNEARALLTRLMMERYPTLDAALVAGNVDEFSLLDQWALRGTLRLNWRIWDFGHLGLRIKEQTQAIEAEKQALEVIKNGIAERIVTAYRDVVTAESRLAAATKSVQAQEERARTAREQFKQNLIPRTEVLRAELALETARKVLVQTQYTMRIDQARLAVATGTE